MKKYLPSGALMDMVINETGGFDVTIFGPNRSFDSIEEALPVIYGDTLEVYNALKEEGIIGGGSLSYVLPKEEPVRKPGNNSKTKNKDSLHNKTTRKKYGGSLGHVPAHQEYLTSVALDIFDSAIAKGATVEGALLVLAQATLESGWGTEAEKYKDYNLFGTMTAGNDFKRRTSAGKVKDYSNTGGYTASINDFYDRINKHWNGYMDLIKKNNFTKDDIDKALNSGTYYPSDKDNFKGKYAYNADKGIDYGTKIETELNYIKPTIIKSIDYQIAANNAQLGIINNSLASIGIFTEQGMEDFEKRKEVLITQNGRLVSTKAKIESAQ